MTEEIDSPPPPQPPFIVAVLDADGVFQRTETIDPAAFDAGVHVHPDEFGGACDLPAGKYRWSAEQKTFLEIRAIKVNAALAAMIVKVR